MFGARSPRFYVVIHLSPHFKVVGRKDNRHSRLLGNCALPGKKRATNKCALPGKKRATKGRRLVQRPWGQSARPAEFESRGKLKFRFIPVESLRSFVVVLLLKTFLLTLLRTTN